MALSKRAGLFASAVAAVTMTIGSVSALAQDATRNFAGAISPTTTSVPQEQKDLAMLPRQDETPVMTQKEAYRASTKQIVLHYGKGIEHIEILAKILRDDGYPAIAVAGGKDGEVMLFVGRGVYGPYNQDQVYGGDLGLYAANRYKERIGEPTNQPPSDMVAFTPAPAAE